MDRILQFNEENKNFFPIIYTGFVQGGPKEARNRDALRKEGKLLTKLKKISEENGTPGMRELKEGEHKLILEQNEIELLNKHMEGTTWSTHVTDVVSEILDWINAAPEVK